MTLMIVSGPSADASTGDEPSRENWLWGRALVEADIR